MISVQDVSKRLGGRWALARLGFELEAGRALLLSGENGAGKTTLLKLLATLTRPTFGTIALFGKPAEPRPEVRLRLGMMSHQTQLYEAMSGRENLAFVSQVLGRAARVGPVLERVGLSQHADRRVQTYSAGMKRRLVLAALLLKDPELVLLDEPWTQLDPAGVELLSGILRELKQAGKTLVVATHDLERGRALCDLELKLVQGRGAGPVVGLS